MSDPNRKVQLVLNSLYISNLNNTTIKTVYLAFKSCKIDASKRNRDKKICHVLSSRKQKGLQQRECVWKKSDASAVSPDKAYPA